MVACYHAYAQDHPRQIRGVTSAPLPSAAPLRHAMQALEHIHGHGHRWQIGSHRKPPSEQAMSQQASSMAPFLAAHLLVAKLGDAHATVGSVSAAGLSAQPLLDEASFAAICAQHAATLGCFGWVARPARQQTNGTYYILETAYSTHAGSAFHSRLPTIASESV